MEKYFTNCNYESYLNAFYIMKSYLAYKNAMETVGMSCESEKTPYGNLISTVENSIPNLIGASLGLQRLHIDKDPNEYPVGQDHFTIWNTPGSEDGWSIDEDNLISFAFEAANNIQLREDMWKAITQHNSQSKERINTMYGKPFSRPFIKIV